jgi:hypothetical protein
MERRNRKKSPDVNISLYLIMHHTMTLNMEEEVQFHTFVSTAQDASRLSVSRLQQPHPKKQPLPLAYGAPWAPEPAWE